MKSTQTFGAIVVGAGHAGVEAALSIARSGHEVLLITMDAKAVARMSCNPAIGGIAKGHMVREIDALGGEMALATDATGIQFKMLNRSKGPAVWSPRAQADKEQYSQYMQRIIAAEKNIILKETQATELLIENGKCCGIQTQEEERFYAEAVILTTGTFLQGLIHVGEKNTPGGRTGEKPAVGLSDSLRRAGIELVRFKTGTPPRLDAKTINWSILEEQKGDAPPQPFSYRTQELQVEQLSCFITHTNPEIHRLIHANLHRSPLYGGLIKGTGTRYCPSVEDKIVKFPDKERHQIYLEPEGRDTDSIYVNGLSTSLPEDVQRGIVAQIPGLENAAFLRLGYAIEYDCAPPTQLKHSLETKQIENLFLAGQINCTSGYEEAAAQGLMAGLNVIRKIRKERPFVLGRAEAYIGVLIDDLVTKGTPEPYRMFTSRAEFRLLLRQDNADRRLMKYGRKFGLISANVDEAMQKKYERIQNDIQALKAKGYGSGNLHRYLKRPGISYKSLENQSLHLADLSEEEKLAVETEVKYEGYISRQNLEVEKLKRLDRKKIPEKIDYETIRGISREAREKFSKIKPISVAQAARIPGISPCDISLLVVHLEKNAASFSS
ncbi:MAG TPA: tRNA uridine-5-carboxymethylaminomethyl(34) synthesis enzyme MnmG [Verrucomicrobiae bacterium]|jgi:tRNA uridine 5-carboxymethylaminomethyl modification enzyme|nr:tRNA uridine-5-carboxymethylaminomethyl(34) synthesis enzyme MnmG [Verrucomicrobiae bacterium]